MTAPHTGNMEYTEQPAIDLRDWRVSFQRNSAYLSLFQVAQDVCKCLLVVLTAFICLAREMARESGQFQVYSDVIELLTT